MIGIEVSMHFTKEGVRKEFDLNDLSRADTSDMEVAAEIFRVFLVRMEKELKNR